MLQLLFPSPVRTQTFSHVAQISGSTLASAGRGFYHGAKADAAPHGQQEPAALGESTEQGKSCRGSEGLGLVSLQGRDPQLQGQRGDGPAGKSWVPAAGERAAPRVDKLVGHSWRGGCLGQAQRKAVKHLGVCKAGWRRKRLSHV